MCASDICPTSFSICVVDSMAYQSTIHQNKLSDQCIQFGKHFLEVFTCLWLHLRVYCDYGATDKSTTICKSIDVSFFSILRCKILNFNYKLIDKSDKTEHCSHFLNIFHGLCTSLKGMMSQWKLT